MKVRNALLYICGLLISFSVFAQKPYLPNGGLFTPKGDIKALVVFVGFSHNVFHDGDSIPFNHQYYTNWDIANGQELPPYVDPKSGKMEIFHDDISDFNQESNPYNISDYYSEMSLGKFHFMAECFKDPKTGKPVRIDINPKGKRSIKAFNKAAIDKIYELYPDFDWSPYDSRENYPNYKRSTAKTRSDGKPDCIIFVYRNHGGMPQQMFKQKRSGWGGGVATSFLSGYKSPWENVVFDNMGFTLSDESGKNGDAFMGMFLHEIAHKLYNSPHYNGANGTIGNYFFYPDVSYGMMNSTNFTNVTANGWERWVLGWINLDKQDADKNQSIDSINGLEHSFVLRDFVTSGDALRLPIPFYPNSYLWIENHQNISVMERNLFGGKVLSITGDTVPKLSKGIYAYVERIAPNRNFLPSYGNRKQSNGLRFMHADGNWDYTYKGVSRSWDTYFYNPVATLKKTRRNPFSGTNPFMRFIDDYPKDWNSGNLPDGTIKYKSSVHGGYLESVPFILQGRGQETVAIYGFSGGYSKKSEKVLKNHSPFFQDKEELSLSSGHPVFGLVDYNRKSAELDHIALNGMHIDFKHIDQNSYLVTVRYNDFSIKKDLRLSGNLKVKPNYLDSTDFSLVINSGVEVTVDKSGTVNTHKKREDDTFIHPTEVVVEKGSKLLMKSKSRLRIKDNSRFVLKSGSHLKMDANSLIIVEKNAQFIIEDGAVLKKGKRVKIIYRK